MSVKRLGGIGRILDARVEISKWDSSMAASAVMQMLCWVSRKGERELFDSPECVECRTFSVFILFVAPCRGRRIRVMSVMMMVVVMLRMRMMLSYLG